MIVLAVMGAIVLSAALLSIAYVVGQRKAATPDKEFKETVRQLQQAVRWIDKALAYDSSVTSLSIPLRDEGLAITEAHYGVKAVPTKTKNKELY